MIRLITVAVKDGGPNVETNARLRMALDMAKGINMPKDNIERAISRASGAEEGQIFPIFCSKAWDPATSPFSSKGITDNKNLPSTISKPF